MLKQNILVFATWYPVISFLCGSLLYTVVLKLLFNACSLPGKDYKVPIDIWTKMDLLSACATMTVFPIVLGTDATGFMDKTTKDLLDYLMIGVIMFQWMRFYQFFLMISELSQMLLTFFSMVIDTLPFMFLVISYLIIATAIFTTLFQDLNSIYMDFTSTIRTLFDGLMGGYTYKGFGEKEWIHMLMIWLHIFMSNILLLNYLIAILSQSYCEMLDKGKFLFKIYLYKYCERYKVGLENKKYG